MRRVFLWAARNRWLKERLPRIRFMRRAVRRFMPGETLADALGAAVPLQADGIATMYTRLGENLENLAEADEVADHYLDAIDQIVAAGIDGEVSVKPTQLGLDLDPEVCLGHLVRIAGPCRGQGLVPLDRHGGQRLRGGHDPALRAAPGGPAADRDLPPGVPAPHRRRPRSGCCRSIPRSAWSRAPTTSPRRSPTQTGASVDANFLGLAVRILLDGRGRPIRLGSGHARRRAHRADRRAGRAPAGIGLDGFEVEMLYGIREDQQRRLAAAGLSGPVADRLRRALVPVVHAPPGRAAGEPVRSRSASCCRRGRSTCARRPGWTRSAPRPPSRSRRAPGRSRRPGRSIIHLQIGEPDFDTPANVREAAKRALDAGETHYAPFAGIPALREAIAADVDGPQGLRRRPVARSSSPSAARASCSTRSSALVDPGDEVIVPDPGYPIYESLARFVGATPGPVPIRDGATTSGSTSTSCASLVTPRTRLLVINSPANPTGGVLTRGDLERIAELAIRHDLWCWPTRSTAGSCTTARSTSRSRRCRAWPSGRSSSTASPRRSR